jgi:hypothetical protein
MGVLQAEMKGAAEEAGLTREEDVMELVKDIRGDGDSRPSSPAGSLRGAKRRGNP